MDCKNADCNEAKLALARIKAMHYKHLDECPVNQAGSLEPCAICDLHGQIQHSIDWEGDRNEAMAARIIEALGG